VTNEKIQNDDGVQEVDASWYKLH